MKRLHASLGILVAVLALTVAVLSCLLFARRNEFRGRADRLADGVAGMVAEIDRNSGSDFRAEVNFRPACDGIPESGTLGWKAYHDARDESGTYQAFQSRLDHARQWAADLNRQRDRLAGSLDRVCADLGMPGDEFEAADLRDLTDRDRCARATARIERLGAAVAARDEAMIRTLLRCSSVLGCDVDAGRGFWERAEVVDEDGAVARGDFRHEQPLADFADSVMRLNARCHDYAEALVDAIDRVGKHRWETSGDDILDPERCAGALVSLQNDLAGINEKLVLYDRAKLEVAQLKDEKEDLIDENERMLRDLGRLEVANARQKAAIAKLEVVVDWYRQRKIVPPVDPTKEVEGAVVQVNEDWNFVIVDLGRGDVQEGMRMLIARGDDLVAKIQISKVLDEICIAEVLPEIRRLSARAGDRVILPYPELALGGR